MSATAQALATPVALVALPVFALLFVTGARRPGGLAAEAVAGVVAVWWLLQPGDLPDQVVRSAAVLTAATFALASTRRSWTFTHRALLALAVAGVTIAAGFLALGWSWNRLHWWVAFRTGAALRLLLVAGTPSAPGAATVDLDRPDFDRVLDDMVRTSADLFPAALALQLLLSLLIAAALAPRLARMPVGRPLGRFVEFRFSEHLGWLLVLSAAILLVPPLHLARPLAVNVLVVMAVLYGCRGIAVVVHALRTAGAGPLWYAVAGIAVFFLLPGTVLLGVLDAGLNLRRRRSPPSGV